MTRCSPRARQISIGRREMLCSMFPSQQPNRGSANTSSTANSGTSKSSCTNCPRCPLWSGAETCRNQPFEEYGMLNLTSGYLDIWIAWKDMQEVRLPKKHIARSKDLGP